MSSLSNLIRIADLHLNPDTATRSGFQKYLMSWYVLKFNTTFKDPTLWEHTFEELLLLYFFYDLRDSPDKYKKVLGDPEADEYEDWLKKQMGDDYVSEEQMAKDIQAATEEMQALALTLPDKITTDFSALGVDDE